MNKLKDIYKTLEVLEFYYSKSNSEEANNYYRNLFVILVYVNVSDAINKFNTFPTIIREKNEMRYLYATSLISIEEKLNEAEELLYSLYFDEDYEVAIDSLVRCYFLEKKYEKLVELLSNLKREKFDKSGFLASMFMISKNYLRKFNEKEIIKYNNSKFKEMPLYYISTAHLLYAINPKNPKVKEQFKKGLKLVNSNDVVAISTICYEAKLIKMNEEVIKFLLNIPLTPYLRIELMDLLINKVFLNEKEILKLEELKESVDKERIDIDYVEGVLLESKGQEIKAIEKYEESYRKKKKKNSAYKYIELSRKNFCEIKDDILMELGSYKDLNSIMMATEGYKYKNDYENAIKKSYKALYLLNKNTDDKQVFRQYFSCSILGTDSLHKNVSYVCKDVVVTMKSQNTGKIKEVVIEDDTFFEEKSKILNVEIIRSTSDLALELINKVVNESITYNNEVFNIENVIDKYTYFYHICFERIKTSKNIEIFEVKNENPEDFIEQLKKKLIDIQKHTDIRFDIYEKTGIIPLSAFFMTEKSAEDYAKIISTLLNDNKRLFYAGEPSEVNINDGFVIDLTSILILAFLGELKNFTKEFCEKIYITTSLKNKVKYYYEMLLKKHGQTQMTIGIFKTDDGSQQLAKNEIDINKTIQFWANIYKYINKFKIEDIEANKDDVFNIERCNFFDKVQFDLIELAKQKRLPYICDDLLIRILANSKYKINHTNSIILIQHFYKNDYDKYLDIIIKLIKSNYIYVMHGKYLSELFVYLYTNYEKKEKVENIIRELLKLKGSFDLHIEMLLNMINNLKNVKYTKIGNNIYTNTRISNIIDMIICQIKDACVNLKLNYEEYEKYIVKEDSGIEIKL